MSTQTRLGGGSRNQKKIISSGTVEISTIKKTEVKIEKEKPHPKPTAEQIRIAQITDISSGSEDPKMREKVATLIEMTQRSEEEVCCALYECDNNLEKAVIFLLETLPVGAFETSSKKKKNRPVNTPNEGNGEIEWTENTRNNDNRERSRNRSSNRGGRGGSDRRRWKSREERENERNSSDTKGTEGGWRGGRGRNSSRGGYGSRGGRGGRMGPRSMGSRDHGRNYSRQQQEPQEVDTWDNAIAANVVNPDIKQDDEWGDWDNEEYVGSLKDSKVFTPSNLQNPPIAEITAPPGMEQHMLNSSQHMTPEELVQQYNSVAATNSGQVTSGPPPANNVQFPEMHSSGTGQHIRLTLDGQQCNASSTLSAEQSQYFNSLPSQNSGQSANVNSYQTNSVQYQTSYVQNAVFGDQGVSSQPTVRRARAKVPPPSKIPSTAVEMPGDTLNNVGYLDVQFGGLDFATEESFDTLTEKFNVTSIDPQNQNVQSSEVTNDYQQKSNSQQAMTGNLQTSQMIPCSDTISSSQNDSITSGYSQRVTSNVQQQSGGSLNASANNTLDQLTKNDPYNASNSSNNNVYQSSYNPNANTKTGSYNSSGTAQGYNSTNYTSVQVSSSNAYQNSASNYNSYNQNSYQTSNNGTSNNVSSSVSGAGVNNNSSTTQNISVVGNGSTVNTGSNTNTGYLSSQYQSNQTASAFPNQQGTYQSNQSAYGSTGLTNNSGFTGSINTSSSQYSNFNSTKLKETSSSGSTHFESVSSVTSSSVASSSVSSVSSSVTAANSMASPSLGLTNAKLTSSTAKSQAGVVPPNIQMVSQYIQTAGLPYYQQPAVYSYEDIQMMQQRMPHVPQYYDINYPPTSLGAAGVRDANLGSVTYSTMTDGRFARSDNNSSPVSNVSSTMSQQTGSAGGPMLNLPYAYFYSSNMMPGGFQYGTPAIYSQQMPTANAASGGQFAKPSYNTGYGSTNYDTLTQATQDYSKGGYPVSGVTPQSNKGQSVTNAAQAGTASDISSMYGKNHVAINKVNTYDKSFHSGTPPPYNLTGTQTAGATTAQPYGMFIQPMPAAHHNMSMHQQIHPDTTSAGQRQASSSQSKSAPKQQGYSPSYWTPQN